jgi:hypothetical protein
MNFYAWIIEQSFKEVCVECLLSPSPTNVPHCLSMAGFLYHQMQFCFMSLLSNGCSSACPVETAAPLSLG